MQKDPIALYIHIPFCRRLCPYCDFHKVEAGPNGVPEQIYLQRLTGQLMDEVERWDLQDRPLISCFFGGGSPSLMGPEFFSAFLEKVNSVFHVEADCEVTAEANPEDLSWEQLAGWKAAGINRVSLGSQSLQPEMLKQLGRTHSPSQVLQSVEWLKKLAFPSVNLDLIFGVAGQSVTLLEKDLEEMARLEPQHISAYQLTVEPATPLASWVQSGKTVLPPDERVVEMHHLVSKKLDESGWKRYEISNYARRGFESRHNLQYWRYGEYLGLGSGAVSFIRDRRWKTTRSLKKYLAGNWAYEDEETIDPKTARGEFCMMGLRLTEGISPQRFQSLFGASFQESYPSLCQSAISKGWMTATENRIALTEEGLLFSNSIFRELF